MNNKFALPKFISHIIESTKTMNFEPWSQHELVSALVLLNSCKIKIEFISHWQLRGEAVGP